MAKSRIHRLLRIATFVGLLGIATLIVAVLVTQTPWFKDWLRRYVVREAGQYVNGQLSIGRLGGNLFTGLELEDVRLSMGAAHVLTIKDVGLDYSAIGIVAKGLVIDDVRINQPRLTVVHDGNGWNLQRLVRKQAQEADREGPARPIRIGGIGVSDGLVLIDDRRRGQASQALPARVARIDLKGRFDYEPVNFTLDVDHLSFMASVAPAGDGEAVQTAGPPREAEAEREPPALALNRLSGRVSVRGDELSLENVVLQTAESSMRIGAVVQDYTGTPMVKGRIEAERLTPRELAAFVPTLATVRFQPAASLELAGPAHALDASLDLRSDAGAIRLRARADVDSAPYKATGTLEAEELRLELVDPAALPASRITAQARFDLTASREGLVTGRISARSPGLAVAGYRAERLEVNARLEPEITRVEGQARAYGTHATVAGTVSPPRAGKLLSADLRGRVADLDMRRLPLPSSPASRLSSNVTAGYHVRLRGADVSGEAVFEPSTIEGAQIAPGTRVTGRLTAGRAEVALRGSLRQLDLPRLGRALGQPQLAAAPVAAPLDVELEITGSGRSVADATGRADVFVPVAHAFGGQFSNVRLDAQANRGAIDGTLAATFEKIDPASLAARQDVGGAVSGRAEISMALPDLQRPQLETLTGGARLDLTPSHVGAARIDRAALDAAIDRGLVHVKRFELASAPADLSASGRLALGPSGTSDLAYGATVKDVHALGALAGQEHLAGVATLEGRIEGPRSLLTTKGTLTATNLRYATTAEVVSVTTAYTATVPDLSFERASGGARMRASLAKALGRDVRDLTLNAEYAEARLAFDTDLTESDRRVSAAGELRLPTGDPSSGGSVTELRLDRFSLRAPDLEWSLAEGPAAVSYGGSRLTVRDLTLQSGPARVSAAGALVAADGAAAADTADPLVVRAEQIDLATLDALGIRAGVTGRLNARAAVSGTLEAPVGDASLTVDTGQIDRFRFDRATVTLHHDPAGTKLDARLDQSPTQWITAKGQLPTLAALRDAQARTTAPIDLRIESSPIDLGIVQTLTTTVREVTGRAEANVMVRGSIGAPRVDGRVRVVEGAFLVDPIETRFTGLDADIVLQGEQLKVESFRLLDTSGNPLTATGGIRLDGGAIGELDVQVKADNFEIVDSDVADVDVDVDLRLGGSPKGMILRGEVGLHEGRIEVDKALEQTGGPNYSTAAAANASPLVPPIDATAPVASAEGAREGAGLTSATSGARPVAETASTPSLLDALAVDVRLRIPDTLVLRGTDLKLGGRGLALGDVNITLGGDIRTRKQPGQRPLVVGSVHTVRGFYEFQNRRFDVQRDGTVSFKGPDALDPSLNLVAQRTISGVDAFVRVRGTAQRPELQLSSAPPLDEADILSLIIFNRPINELGQGEQTTLAQRGGELVGGMVASPLAEALRDALDVDLLEISAASDNAGGPAVTVGDQIGERVFVRVRQQFGAGDATALLLEYQIADFLRLQTNVSEGAETSRVIGDRADRGGIDLIFVVRY